MESTDQILAQLQELLTVYGLKALAALLILLVGRILAGWMRTGVKRLMARGRTDPMIVGFVGSFVRVGVLVFVVLAALRQVGTEITGFIAVLGAAALAIGLALLGSLSNFAAGFLLIMLRLLKAGDFIKGAGVSGSAQSIRISTTMLNTPDRKT